MSTTETMRSSPGKFLQTHSSQKCAKTYSDKGEPRKHKHRGIPIDWVCDQVDWNLKKLIKIHINYLKTKTYQKENENHLHVHGNQKPKHIKFYFGRAWTHVFECTLWKLKWKHSNTHTLQILIVKRLNSTIYNFKNGKMKKFIIRNSNPG